MNSPSNPSDGFEVGWWNDPPNHFSPTVPQSPSPLPRTDWENQSDSASNLGKSSREIVDIGDHTHQLAAIIEIVSLLNTSESIKLALELLAKTLKKWFSADTIDVYWQDKPCHPAIHYAHIGKAKGDSDTAEMARSAAAEEVLSRKSVADSHATAKHDQFSLLALKHYTNLVASSRVIALPLSCNSQPVSSQCCGSVLIQFGRPVSENEAAQIKNALTAAREPLSHALMQVHRVRASRWISLFRDQISRRKRHLIAAALAVFAGIMMIPTPYYAPFQSKLEPIGRRFVAAPIDAPLQQVFVRPGDHVQNGMLLARMDDREIEMELIGKQAELVRLQQEQKGFMAQHRQGETRLAKLKLDRIRSEIEMLELRRDRLAILSPIDGVVIAGDWERSEGSPMTRGETLFEIAPLGQFNVEIELDESDVMRVRKGMALTFRLDAIANQKFSTNIAQIHPQSEIRGDENVFLADAMLQDPDELLRPGMEGSGYIRTDEATIGWNLFHKAYHRLLVLIGV